MSKNIKAIIIGASGYTGVEAIRLLLSHPHAEIIGLVANSNAGKDISELYPAFASKGLPTITTLDQAPIAEADVLFCCLPHAMTQEVVKTLPQDKVIIDLSADFRLRDVSDYANWYGHEHLAPELQADAVYGLSEHYREQIKTARIIACPGCYPTSILLPLLPLLQAGVVDASQVLIDSKTGISGAGRAAKVAMLFAETNESVKAYGVDGHRHLAEIEQEALAVTGEKHPVSFTPQIVPMTRGILSNLYLTLAEGKTLEDATTALATAYANEPFVSVVDAPPATGDVKGTNECRISVHANRVSGKITVLSVIDNLCKGSSGQAVQNMNIRFGLPETIGLEHVAVVP